MCNILDSPDIYNLQNLLKSLISTSFLNYFLSVFLNHNKIHLFWLAAFLVPQFSKDAYEHLMSKRLIIQGKGE